jgi:Flp pilus assembly pilin Flp
MKVINAVSQFASDENGLETVEWAVMGALIAAGLLATVVMIGTQLLNKFTALQTATS